MCICTWLPSITVNVWVPHSKGILWLVTLRHFVPPAALQWNSAANRPSVLFLPAAIKLLVRPLVIPRVCLDFLFDQVFLHQSRDFIYSLMMMSNLTFLYQQQDNYCPQSALFYISVSVTPDHTAFHDQSISSQNFGWHALDKSQSGYIDDRPSPPRFNKIPNPSFDECAAIEQDTAEGLARACRVISSWDCVRLKNTEFHTELARPAGTGRYWFSNRVERGGRKCSIQTREMKRGGHYVRRASRKEGQKRLSEETLGPGYWNFISVILHSFFPLAFTVGR